METAVYDALKEKLGDAKIKIGEEEKGLLEIVSYWEEGVEKTKVANKDLTRQREEWEKQEKEYKKQLGDLGTVKTDLEKKLEELSGKSGKKSQESEELQKQLNAAIDKIKTVEEAQQAAEKKAREAEEKSVQANKVASEEGLKKDLLTELAENKIVGTQGDFAVTTIMAKGFAKLVPDETTGLYKRSFCTKKDGKELAAELKSMCKWFAEANPFLVASSGKPGTGSIHDGGKTGESSSGGRRNYMSMISQRK